MYEAVYKGATENLEILLNSGAEVNFSPDLMDRLYRQSKDHVFRSKTLEAIFKIQKHVIKLKILNLASEEVFENWRFLNELQLEELKVFEAVCKIEAEKIKQFICSDRNVKFADLITKSSQEVARFLGAEEIKQKLTRVNFDIEFPIYSCLLKTRFTRNENLAQLLSQAFSGLKLVLQNKMSYLVLKKILSYLSQSDLGNLNF